MLQKTIIFERDSISDIKTQLKDFIEENCIDDWYVHLIQPVYTFSTSNGDKLLNTAIIILNKTI